MAGGAGTLHGERGTRVGSPFTASRLRLSATEMDRRRLQPRGRRPTIGVTGPNRGGGAAWLFTRLGVFLAGGHAVRITPKRPHPIEQFDGLIIGGGADVNPKLYGQDLTPIVEKEKSPEQSLLEYLLGWVLFPLTFLLRKLAGQSAVRGGDAARDALEMKLIDGAVRRRLP